METKITVAGLGCHACGKLFKNGDIINCPTVSDYAYDVNCIFESDLERNSPYYQYLNCNGIGKLIINDRYTAAALSDGCYKIKWDGSVPYIGASFKPKEDVLSNFIHQQLPNEVVVEVNNRYCLFRLHEDLVICTADFVPDESPVSRLAKHITTLFNAGKVLYLRDRNKKLIGFKTYPDYGKDEVAYPPPKFRLQPSGTQELSLEEVMGIESPQDNALRRKVAVWLKSHPPEELLSYLEKHIRGQDVNLKIAAYLIYKYLQCIASGKPFNADNWLLAAPSGSGKTELYRQVNLFFKMNGLPIPIIQIDLSQVTETGFKGDDVSSIPKRILSEAPDSMGYAICFLDEADKKCIPSYSSGGVDVNRAVQSNLLTLIEGINTTVEVNDNDKPFDSNHTMFVLMGAFQNVRNAKKEKRSDKNRLGFSSTGAGARESLGEEAFHEDITLQDIIDFGMQEELAGRMVQVVNFRRLSEKDMLLLIKEKTKEISKALDIDIEITNKAATEFLEISFSPLGVRAPMNRIKELTQNKVAEIFFNPGFNSRKITVVIDSLNSARIKKRTHANETEE